MRLRTLTISLVVAATVLLGVSAFAQEASKLEGTVYLRSGQTLSGVIRIAELGIVAGSGIGNLLGDGGSFGIKINGERRIIPAADLAVFEAQWVNEGTTQDPHWQIGEITITTKAGETIVGTPTWILQASNVSIEGQPTVGAFPMAGIDFSPDNFISKIVLGEPLPEEVPSPAEEAPPAVEEAPAIVMGPPEEISLPPPLVATAEGIAIPAEAVSFTITCPECGEKIRITIKAEVAEQ